MSEVDYAILGAMTVRVAPEAAPVQPAEQIELLLGRLLLRPGARVTTDELADALWDDAARADPRNGVQVAVRAARTLLGDERPFGVIVRDGDGYRLVVDDALRIDAERFKRLATRGRDLVVHRPWAARAMLVEALATWRGRLLGEHAERAWVRGHARELDSIRNGAEVNLNEARLALEEHAELEPVLRHQIALHPLDERRHGQLVRALHGDGRTAEAMNAYRNAYRELGVPGPELRRIGEVVGRTRHFEAPLAPLAGPPHPAACGGRSDSLLLCGILSGEGRSAGDPGAGTLALVVDQHGGDPQSVGDDRLIATFEDPDAALSAAGAIVSLGRLGAGVGVHAGGALFLGGAVDGPGPTHCWEVAAAAHPGQVLVSDAARARGGPSHDLRDLGPQRLADLGERETVFELAPGLRAGDFPPPGTLDRLPHNLPEQQTHFLGRRAELSELSKLVARGELITMVGLGGCGKTRLALQLAAQQIPAFVHGAWFVALAELARDAGVESVALAVANQLGVRPLRGETLPDSVVRHLSDRTALLVVDNCEHVHEACAALISAVRAGCLDVCVLATSRRPLGVVGERIWRVPPMTTDASGAPGALSDAVMLLLERAGMLFVGPTVIADALAFSEHICRAFEGLPLAIELAARQVAMRGLAAVAADVDAIMLGKRPLHLLESRDHGRPDRQRTLEAAIGWSYRLLSPDERLVLRRLAVFRGSFGVAEAQRLASGGEFDGVAVARILTSLVESSMVAPAQPLEGAARLRLVEPIGAFALGRLQDSGELEPARAAHAKVFRTLAEESAPRLFGPDEQSCLERFEIDHDNMRAALAWYVDGSRSEEALRLVGALWWLWFSHGHLEEGCSWVRSALAIDDEPTRERVRALRAGSHLTWWRGDFAESEGYNAALERCAVAIGDEWGQAWAPMGVGAVELFRDPRRALTRFEDSKRRFDGLGRRWEAGYALQVIGGARWFARDEQAAGEAFEQAVEIFEQLGHRSVLASVRRSAGLMASRCGHPARGTELCRAALRLSDEIGDRAGSAQALNFLAAISRDDGDLPTAVARYADALSLAREVGELWATCWALDGLAGAVRLAGEAETAAGLLACSGRLATRAGYRPPPHEHELREHDIAVLRAELDEQDFERAAAAGELMDVGEAVSCALAFAKRYS